MISALLFRSSGASCSAEDRATSTLLTCRSGDTSVGEVIPLNTDAQARRGETGSRYCSFPYDNLSGLRLDQREGTITVLQLPSGNDPVVKLRVFVNDGGLDGTYESNVRCVF